MLTVSNCLEVHHCSMHWVLCHPLCFHGERQLQCECDHAMSLNEDNVASNKLGQQQLKCALTMETYFTSAAELA